MLVLLLVGAVDSARAAYISEIDLGGPAGRAVELSELEAGKSYSLLVLDANANYQPAFGRVMGVVVLPAGISTGGVVMVSEQPWPDETGQTVLLSSLPAPTTSSSLNLSFSRLLLLHEGLTDLEVADNVLSPTAVSAGFDASAVEDWVLMGSGPIGAQYLANGYNMASINATLGIDLLSQVADTAAGRVIGRASLAGEAIDPGLLHVGTPNVYKQFLINEDYRYTYTPGAYHAPLLPNRMIPEPGVAWMFGAGLAVCLRRRD